MDQIEKGIQEEYQHDFIKFLGTAGARFVVSRQLRASGGLWISLAKSAIMIDPGPGALVRILSSRPKMDPAVLDGIILTHRHLDHANDVNVMVEAMTNGGRHKKGFLYAPRDVFAAPAPVVQPYVLPFLKKIEYLEAGKKIRHSSFTLETPVVHHHPVETYGLKFHLPYGQISLISDTAFFPELIDHYGDADLLILNVVFFQEIRQSKIYHLNLKQAREIINAIRPKVAVLTHFGMTMLQQKPFLLALQLQEELGLKVIAANDGLKLPLVNLLRGAE